MELFRSYLSKLASSNIDSSSPTSYVSDDMDMLEAISFTHDDQILNTDIIMEEIEATFIALKCGRSKGADGLNSEQLKLWLKKIFNAIVSLEEIPSSFKEGIVIPIYKGKGKDLLLTSTVKLLFLASYLI